jgi:hypothetical protein
MQPMTEQQVPKELSKLDSELAGAQRRAERRFEPGGSALVIACAVLVLMIAATLPWSGSATGWQVLTGAAEIGPLPRVFAVTAIGFGIFVSTAALIVRRWGLAWLAAVGCGFSILDGVVAIWSRLTVRPDGIGVAPTSGPAIGLILAWVAIIVLAVSWVRLAWSRR